MNFDEALTDLAAENIDRIAADIETSKDAGYAQVVADSAKRRLRGTLIGASLARLIPMIENLMASGGLSEDGLVSAADDGKAITAEFRNSDGGAAFRAEIRREETRSHEPKYDFLLSRVSTDGTEGDEPVLFGGMFWMDRESRGGIRETVVFANVNRPARIPDWFAFSEMAMASLPEAPQAEALRIMDCWDHESALALVMADGGLAGRRCRILIEEQERAIMKALLPWFAPMIVEVGTVLRDSGFVWGHHYLAYNDTDIRCCAVPVQGGVAIFHENIDLIADHSQFVAKVDLTAEGKPRGISIHGLDRYKDSPSLLIEALMTGVEVPTPNVALDIESGEISMPSAIDVTQVSDYLHCALEGNIDAIGEWVSGEREWHHARKDFQGFEPWNEEDDEFEDEEDEAITPGP